MEVTRITLRTGQALKIPLNREQIIDILSAPGIRGFDRLVELPYTEQMPSIIVDRYSICLIE